jgi:peptidyl-prolyl cis-trans isomerase C
VKRLLPVLSIVLSVPLTFACRQAPPPRPRPSQAHRSRAQPAPPHRASQSADAGAAPPIVAKVNGEAVERWELENAIHALEGRAGAQIPPDKRDEILRGLLDQLVRFHVLVQESRARKLEVSDAELDARLAEIKKGFPNDQAFQQELASQGLTVEQLRFQARSTMQVSKLVDAEIKPKISVQETDVDAFYKENVEKFKQAESVHASHIMIGLPPNADAPTKQQARAKAQQVLKEVRAGGDFGKLAAENSNDPGSAAKGGDLGFFPKGQMEPAFETAAFALKPGAVSGIVETSFGFHIIKVLERRPPHRAFEEASGQIKEP